MKHISKNLRETSEIARKFLDTLRPTSMACVVALQGDLGAGKTAFAKAVGEILGVKENVTSPTFVIEKIYPIDPATAGQAWKGFKNFIHIDAYRLEKESELLHLGWEEMVREPENLILIEWPENVPGIIPEDAKRINFKFVDEGTREISYES
jgi:tRNA threonylcarbamoyladenosine biosynthesis protein TsaE